MIHTLLAVGLEAPLRKPADQEKVPRGGGEKGPKTQGMPSTRVSARRRTVSSELCGQAPGA